MTERSLHRGRVTFLLRTKDRSLLTPAHFSDSVGPNQWCKNMKRAARQKHPPQKKKKAKSQQTKQRAGRPQLRSRRDFLSSPVTTRGSCSRATALERWSSGPHPVVCWATLSPLVAGTKQLGILPGAWGQEGCVCKVSLRN